MSTSQKPTVVCVPGGWHSPDCYDTVRQQLSERGYPTVPVSLPCVGAEPPTKDLSDDATHLRTVLTEIADQGKSIILIAHSYGGFVAGSAVEGLGFTQRLEDGKKGGIIRLIYLAAFATHKGTSLMDTVQGKDLPWWKREGNYIWSSDEANIFYHDVPEATQSMMINKLTWHSAPSFNSPVTSEPWTYLPCMYVFCRQDRAIPFFVQEKMVAGMGDILTLHWDSSHSPFLSMPEKVVEAVEIAEKADGTAK